MMFSGARLSYTMKLNCKETNAFIAVCHERGYVNKKTKIAAIFA